MLNVDNLKGSTPEWQKADFNTRKAFDDYVEKFYEENHSPMAVPLTFKAWLEGRED